jgi:hypothetical protein
MEPTSKNSKPEDLSNSELETLAVEAQAAMQMVEDGAVILQLAQQKAQE